MNNGIKHDQGKPPMDLLPHDALVEVAKVLGFGEQKYAAGNWANGLEFRRLISAAQRHIGEFNSGVDNDSESGLSHVAHAACCLLFILSLQKRKPEMDNRWEKAPKARTNPLAESLRVSKPLKLEVGKLYLRRDGKKCRVIEDRGDNFRCSRFKTDDPCDFLHSEDGKHNYTRRADLIEDITEPCISEAP